MDGPCLRTKKDMEQEGGDGTSSNWCAWNGPQRLGKGAEKVGNGRKSKDHPNYSIIKIDQNTEKSPGNLKRLAVTQTSAKNHQLTPMWKTRNEWFNLPITKTSHVRKNERGWAWDPCLLGLIFCGNAYNLFQVVRWYFHWWKLIFCTLSRGNMSWIFIL